LPAAAARSAASITTAANIDSSPTPWPPGAASPSDRSSSSREVDWTIEEDRRISRAFGSIGAAKPQAANGAGIFDIRSFVIRSRHGGSSTLIRGFGFRHSGFIEMDSGFDPAAFPAIPNLPDGS
jgi:hypothetical protein